MARNVGAHGAHSVSQLNKLYPSLFNGPGIKRHTRQLFSSALNTLAPRHCSLCEQQTEAGFCSQCQRLLPWINHPCEGCGINLPTSTDRICGGCQNASLPWSRMIVPMEYSEPVSGLVQKFKYGRRQDLAYSMAKVMVSAIIKSGSALPDTIVPVPAFRDKLVSRGYNQAQVIATEFGKLLEIPVYNSLIIKTRKTLSQTQIGLASRQKNLKGAFKLSNRTKIGVGLSIVVVDDVVTSGATMRAICEVLQGAGINQISVCAFARATIR